MGGRALRLPDVPSANLVGSASGAVRATTEQNIVTTRRQIEDKQAMAQMTAALASYTGPVTQCPTGHAKGDEPVKAKPGPDLSAAGWQAPPPDRLAQRRQRRMAQAKRQRINEHNAAVRKASGLRKSRGRRAVT
jgi:hypothetical protein